VIVRDMHSGEQVTVPVSEIGSQLAQLAASQQAGQSGQ